MNDFMEFNFDFSEDWEEVQAVNWEWIMWKEEGENVIGWIIEIKDEEFTDKDTGEVRTNRVCYMALPNGKFVRFITPTDLKTKLQILNERRESLDYNWSDIMVNITYNGKVQTSKGYEVKTFSVKVKKQSMPENIKEKLLNIDTNCIEF
jgi:hypothetical protein